MSWLNTNYILRAGVLSVLLLLPGLMSATCKRDTIINNYKDDSLRFIIKDDSIITFRNGESSFTIIKAELKLDEVFVIFRRIVVYQRKQLFNSINGPIVLGFVLNLCHTCPTFICSDNLSCRIPYTSLWIGYIQTEL